MADFVANGIDISEFNGDVNIAALKGKVDFIIIRCGYGGDYESQDDSQYWANVRKCQEAGIPFGVYLYSYARNMEMAMSEARHTLRLAKRWWTMCWPTGPPSSSAATTAAFTPRFTGWSAG